MKKLMLVLVLALPMLQAHAKTLGFDSLSTGSGGVASIPDGYGGMQWVNMNVVNTNAAAFSGTNYMNAAVSGTNVATIADPSQLAGFGSATAFTFANAYFTDVNNLTGDAMGSCCGGTVTVTGYALENGLIAQVDQTTLPTNPMMPTYWNFDWSNLNAVTFSYTAGQNSIGDTLAIDNIDPSPSATPLPGAAWLMGSALVLGFLAMRRKNGFSNLA
jgi:hypothetical protein